MIQASAAAYSAKVCVSWYLRFEIRGRVGEGERNCNTLG